jgi:N-acetylmuramic acid 6-phosphate etherase
VSATGPGPGAAADRAADAIQVRSPTEGRNPRTTQIDAVPTLELLRLLNAEDALVPAAVAAALPELARAVDLAVERVRAGGRVHYFGAGSSGRLAVVDAAELPPTFGTDPGLVVAHQAGGLEAIAGAVEDVEDAADLGAADAAAVSGADVAVGVTASGRTPYVEGALRAAARRGAATVLVSSNPRAPLAAAVDVHVAIDTGPEAIAGSTRLKAGTAAKLALNCLSTALMVRLGHTWSNLMVSVLATNAKLRGRVLSILREATGEPEERCRAALEECGGELKTALVSMLSGRTPEQARAALGGGVPVRAALQALASQRRPGPPP